MHTIRLRGPWQLEPVERFVPQPDGSYHTETTALPSPARLQMPADWSDAFGRDFLGRVRYTRNFNKPTGLDSGERVFLVVEPPRSSCCILLHGKLVGFVHPDDSAQRFDITARLNSSNDLVIVVDHPDLDAPRSTVGDPSQLPPGGLIGEVRLEIEEN